MSRGGKLKLKKGVLSQGFSLIEMVIAMGILGVVSLGFATFTRNLFTELRYANQKMETISLSKDLELVLMANLDVCSEAVRGKRVNLRDMSPQAQPNRRADLDGVALSDSVSLRSGAEVPGTVTGLAVENLYLEIEDAINGSDRNYAGHFVVEFNSDSMVRSIQPIRVRQLIGTNPSTPLGAREITGCIDEDEAFSITQDRTFTGGGGVQHSWDFSYNPRKETLRVTGNWFNAGLTYTINSGLYPPNIELKRGETYIFNRSGSYNSAHPRDKYDSEFMVRYSEDGKVSIDHCSRIYTSTGALAENNCAGGRRNPHFTPFYFPERAPSGGGALLGR